MEQMILWKYEAKYVSEFRFGERDIPRLSEALQLPHKIVCCQETVQITQKHCANY